jgi:hypothetical protein
LNVAVKRLANRRPSEVMIVLIRNNFYERRCKLRQVKCPVVEEMNEG